MIDSIFIALSGMQGHQRGLNVISNNVSNMNTVGFRGSSVSFADVFSGSTQTTLPDGELVGQQGAGGGLDASRTLLDLHSVDATQTGRDLDLALQGDGFFVLQDENGETLYTRAGGFDFDNDGVLVAAGQKLKVMSRNASGQLVPIELKDLQVSPSKPTTKATFSGTLSSDSADAKIDSLVVFDKQGNKHTLQVTLTKDTTQQPFVHWKVSVTENSLEVGTSDLEFTSPVGAPSNSPLQVTLALAGTDPAEFSFDFSSVQIGPFGSTNSQLTASADGLAAGTISAKTFDATGVLKITYSNGQTADGAQLVLAQISDAQGLEQLGNSLFAYKGVQPITLREAGDDLKLRAQALEPSNVDLTQEFSELILMQRGYQAASQVVSTANDMLQELLQMRSGR